MDFSQIAPLKEGDSHIDAVYLLFRSSMSKFFRKNHGHQVSKFFDALNNRNETRMIIVNREPDSIRSKIQNFPEDKIDIITTPFGHTTLIDELNQVLRQTPKGF